MREQGSSGVRTDKRVGSLDVHRNAWQRTLEDVGVLVDEHEGVGRRVVRVVADDTAPEHPSSGSTDRFGLVHVVPRNHAEELAEVAEQHEFVESEVYLASVEGRVFLVTELSTADSDCVVLIAGTYERRAAASLRETAAERGEMYTHVQKVDTTHVASFRHENPEAFFPE